jgi:hypothetical protein
MGAIAAGAATGDRAAAQGGIRFGNLYINSGLTTRVEIELVAWIP